MFLPPRPLITTLSDTCYFSSSLLRLQVRDPQRSLIDPAVIGTENVLTSVAKVNSVRRVVLTSSVAAVAGRNDEKATGIYTEEDWNSTSTLSVSGHMPSGIDRLSLSLFHFLSLCLHICTAVVLHVYRSV